MSPMIKPGDPPVPLDVLSQARASLPRDHGFTYHREDGRQFLLARVPADRPDPAVHLEAMSFSVDETDLQHVHDVLLVGDERVLRVEPVTLRDLVRERMGEDEAVETHLRKRLQGPYDYTVFRHQETRHHLRLGVRIPRATVADTTPDDVAAIRDEVVPVLDTPKGDEIRAFYVVAEDDAERLSRRAFLDVIDHTPPKREPPEPEPASDDAEAADIEAPRDTPPTPEAEPPAPDTSPGDKDDGAEMSTRAPIPPAARAAAQRLRDAGYEVLESIEHGGHSFDLAAHRQGPGGKRLLIRTLEHVDPPTVQALHEVAGELEAHAVIALHHGLTEGAREASWGTRVVLVPAGSAGSLLP